MQRLLPLFLPLILCFGCQSSKSLRLDGMTMTELDPLILEPGYDPYELRIDILRQLQSDYDLVMEMTNVEKVPYHPIGFDLGNGLFFDLNENLSLKINQLSVIDDPGTFKVMVVENMLTERGITYAILPDRYCVTSKGGTETCFDTPRKDEQWQIHGKRRLDYAIVEKGDQLTYQRKVSRPGTYVDIKSMGDGRFVTEGKGPENIFIQRANTVELAGKYLIKSTSNGRRLEIYKIGKRVNKALYAIEKSEDTYFIYDRKRRGKTITLKTDRIDVVQNDKVQTRIKILD